MTIRTLTAMTLATLLATAATAEAKPSKLWYRIQASFSETLSNDIPGYKRDLKDTWGVASNGAVIVSIVCVGRRTLMLLANRPCARAYRRVHWRRFARDDLAFGAAVSGLWDTRLVEQLYRGHPEPVPESGGFIQCSEERRSYSLQKAARIAGIMATDSLVRAGVGLQLEPAARTPGESWSTSTGYKCVHTGYDGTFLREDSIAGHDLRGPFTGVPSHRPEELQQLRLSEVTGNFGRSFSITRTFRSPQAIVDKRESKITVRFKICPRGGRAVGRC
jgi:hypothetical protein